MKAQVMLLNVLKYENEKGKGTRVGIIFCEKDSLQNSEKFKGFSEVSLFYDVDVFDKIPTDFIGRPVTAYITERSSAKNPLRKSQIISSLEYDNRSIDLLQPELI